MALYQIDIIFGSCIVQTQRKSVRIQCFVLVQNSWNDKHVATIIFASLCAMNSMKVHIRNWTRIHPPHTHRLSPKPPPAFRERNACQFLTTLRCFALGAWLLIRRFGTLFKSEPLNMWYCWWTKSCTTKDDDDPIIYRVLTIPDGAGFCPSTVVPPKF